MKQKSGHVFANLRVALALAITGAGLPACAQDAETNEGSAWPAMRALGRELPVRSGECESETQTAQSQPRHEPGGVLTLRQALELALIHNPELDASSHGVRAAQANARQAAAWRNPELELDAEGFAGSGARKGYATAETSLRLSQSVELGGKRSKRRRAAQSEARLAGWDYEAKRLDVLTRAKKAFVDVLLAQGQLALAESSLAVAEDVREATAKRVRAGDVAPLEETKARVGVAAARIARDRAKHELETARKRLSASWGGTMPVFKEAGGDLNAVGDVPSLKAIASLVDEAPEVARWSTSVALAGESLAAAKSARIPDVGISVGIGRFEEDDAYAGTVGLSLPLPLFDRNEGGILAAKHEAIRAEYEQRAARLRAATDLAEAHSRLETAREEAESIQTELLPGARQAFDAARTGYREGKFGHLEVLDAQRTLNEAKTRHLETLAAYHKAAADVERLIGAPLNMFR